MSVGDDAKDGSFEKANSMLTQGLKSCRAVVDSYRSLLASEARSKAAAQNDTKAALDEPEDFQTSERAQTATTGRR